MTKIKLIILGFTILTFESIFGQENKIDIGPEGGPSLIFMRGNAIIASTNSPTIGFSGGVFLQYNFKKILSLRTSIAYERKGSIVNGQAGYVYGNPIDVGTTHINDDYLTIPLLVRAKFGRKMKYFFNAGPYLGYLLKETFVLRGENTPKTKIDNTSLNKRFDYGLSTGLGFVIPIKDKFAFSIEIRNNLGLFNTSAVSVVNNGTIKTNSTNLLFGFTYKLGRKIEDEE